MSKTTNVVDDSELSEGSQDTMSATTNPVHNSQLSEGSQDKISDTESPRNHEQSPEPPAAGPVTSTITNNNVQTAGFSSASSNITINGDRATNSFSTVHIILTIITAVVIYCWFYSSPKACDMTIAENKDFHRYYGIADLKNHFTIPTADECDPGIIFKPALPQSVLKSDNSASSFLILAPYGSGKTLLRCEYTKSLKSENYLKVIILNKQIGEYIERFVTKTTGNEKNCENINCLQGWTENEFAQLLLSTLVTEFINIFLKENIKLKDTSIEEKIELITIICYYYNGFVTSEFEKFINIFLNKSLKDWYRTCNANVQIQERNVAQDKPLLIHFKKDLEKFSVLKQHYERLHLLLAVIEGEGFQHKAMVKNMYGNVFNDLTHFSLYIKNHMNKIPVFIIDGIDENQYFFHNNSINKASIESFCSSSLSQQILAKVMANNFYLSIFYRKIDEINIQDVITRKDKFPTYGITWNTKSLINYADYVLQYMNSYASSSRCEPFTDFKTLVNYSNTEITEIINKIPTPRSLHYFMIELIKEMENYAGSVRKPFKATLENVENAYKKII